MKKVMDRDRIVRGRPNAVDASDTDTSANKSSDFFQSEFQNEKRDSTQLGKVFDATEITPEPILRKAKVYEYRPPKFFNDYVVAGLNNTNFGVNRFQPYAGGAGPIDPANGNDLNGLIRMGTVDLFEDYKISGGIRLAPNLKDNDILFQFNNLRKRFDWGFTYYRSNVETFLDTTNGQQPADFVRQHSNYYLAHLKYAFDRVRSVKVTVGPRFDRSIYPGFSTFDLKVPDVKKTYGQFSVEYVHDNTLNPTMNIWKGLRWKAYVDWFTQLSKIKSTEGKFLFNAGFDARHYLPIYRNVIWAVRAAGDFSWGSQKVVYYLGGVDGWLKIRENQKVDQNTGEVSYRYFDPSNQPDPDADYAYQALAVNLRGFKQNIANGNNNVVINSEIRMPVFSTLLNRPINNAFIRNFQLVQFIDLGTAWNGGYDKFERPSIRYQDGTDPNNPITVRIKAGGIGPFAGGYGFGARSTLLGYFVRFDVAWQMDGLFRGKPQTYLGLGVDF
ncbi:MAG TPA: hypothetical protein VHK91_04545, partial [Flavisolibacter sp.]|jgi:hypothetical protein|nr:hypothetical protein [Flavisolibacter sp.]